MVTKRQAKFLEGKAMTRMKARRRDFLKEVRDILKIANVKPSIAKLHEEGSFAEPCVVLGGLVHIQDESIDVEDIYTVFYYESENVFHEVLNGLETSGGWYDKLYYAVIAAVQFYVKAEIINEMHTRWADEAERRDEYLAERRGR